MEPGSLSPGSRSLLPDQPASKRHPMNASSAPWPLSDTVASALDPLGRLSALFASVTRWRKRQWGSPGDSIDTGCGTMWLRIVTWGGCEISCLWAAGAYDEAGLVVEQTRYDVPGALPSGHEAIGSTRSPPPLSFNFRCPITILPFTVRLDARFAIERTSPQGR